jgi:repressor LexA
MRSVGEPLTKRQHDVMTAVARLERERGYAPSVRELGRELGLSPATVQEHLVALERKGHLRRSGGAFGLQLLSQPPGAARESVVHVPVRGTIAAGEPLEAVEEREETIPMPRRLVRGDCFFLRVRGNSMRDDHILDGDLVLVRRQDSVNNGEIAVALLPDGTATLKRVYKERGRFRLQPANEALSPIFVDALHIQGKVISVQRTFA